jgi:hypothetical protein
MSIHREPEGADDLRSPLLEPLRNLWCYLRTQPINWQKKYSVTREIDPRYRSIVRRQKEEGAAALGGDPLRKWGPSRQFTGLYWITHRLLWLRMVYYII